MILKSNKDVITEWIQLAQTQPLDKLPEVLQQAVSYGRCMSVVYLIAAIAALLGFITISKDDSNLFLICIIPVTAVAFALEHLAYVWLAPHIYLIEQLTAIIK